MKKYLAWILIVVVLSTTMPSASLAQTVRYEPVQVILRANDELKYREAAAEVIESYLTAYCLYNTSDSFANQLPEVVSRTGVSPEALKGIYREYYLTAELKFEFDTEEKKTKYSSARPDDPKKAAEWDKQQKEIYMTMISDTIIQKAKADPEQWIGESYSFNMKTGKFEYDPYIGALSSIGDEKSKQAWSNFAIEMAETIGTVCFDYLTLNKTSPSDFIKSIGDSAINAAANVASVGVNTFFENEIKELENQIISLSKEKIKENVECADEKIVKYLQEIYEGKDPDFEKAFTDPITKKILFDAVNDILVFVDAQGKKDAINEANNMIDDWFENNGFSVEEILSSDEIWNIAIQTAISEFSEGVISSLKKALNDVIGGIVDSESPILPSSTVKKNEDAYLWLSGIMDAFFNALSDAISAAADEAIEAIKNQGEETDKGFVDRFTRSFSQHMIKDLSSTLAKNFKEDRFKSDSEKVEEFGAGLLAKLLGRIAQAQDAYTAHLKGDTTLSDKFWSDLGTDILTILIENISLENAGKTIAGRAESLAKDKDSKLNEKIIAWVENSAGKALEKIGEVLKYVSPDKWYDLIYEPAKAGAEAMYNTDNSLRGEDEDSLRAANTFAAYTVSNKYRTMVNVKISEMITKAQNPDLKQIITDPDLIPIEDIRDVISYIMLQVENDQVGQKWLMDILGKNEKEFWDSHFYNYLMKCIKPSEIWTNNMTLDKATQRYNDMNGCANLWSDLLSAA